MRLGFYYHISVYKDSIGNISLQSSLGVFLDELAKNVGQLVLLMHTSSDKNKKRFDYTLTSQNIRLIDLGKKTHFFHRMIFGNQIIKKVKQLIPPLDLFLVRAPTPLGPFIYDVLNDKTPVTFLFVGDYSEGSKQQQFNVIKKSLISVFTRYYEFRQNRVLPFCNVLVNSKVLKIKYKPLAKSVTEVRTTTLKDDDFHFREDTCLNKTITILYVGRIEYTKGLNELIDAGSLLKSKNIEFKIVIVGDTTESKLYVESLINRAKQLDIYEKVSFEGIKSRGSEINECYRSADIFVIPSYHEGFPRVIWEAMANSLPVVATKVGSIPYFLEDKIDALLIDPKNASQLFDGLCYLMNDKNSRKQIICNAYNKATGMKLDIQTDILVKKMLNSL